MSKKCPFFQGASCLGASCGVWLDKKGCGIASIAESLSAMRSPVHNDRLVQALLGLSQSVGNLSAKTK